VLGYTWLFVLVYWFVCDNMSLFSGYRAGQGRLALMFYQYLHFRLSALVYVITVEYCDSIFRHCFMVFVISERLKGVYISK